MPTNLLSCVWYRESTAVMRLQCTSGCGKSTIKVTAEVCTYVVSKAHIQLKYGKSTVKYGRNIVDMETFLVSTVC